MHRRMVRLALFLALLLPLPLSAQLTVSGRGASLRIGGRLHSQYAMSSVDGATDDFFIRRARIIADLTINDFLTGRVQTDFAGGTATLKDAYASLNFSDGFQLAFGQFKRAFDIFELASSTDLSLIERDGRVAGVNDCGANRGCTYSRLTEHLEYADRDVGIRVEGESGSVSYMATLTNGTGVNVPDENDGKSASGRLAFAVNEDVTIAGQVALHDYIDPAAETSTAVAFGGDVQFGTWRDGLLVQGAIVSGENWDAQAPGQDAPKFLTFQGVASYYIPVDNERVVGIEPLGRISWADPDTDTDDDQGLLITPGFMVYIMGRSKIGANVDIYSPAVGDKEFSFKIQSFLYF
jgi:hypothetical protein